MEIPVWLQLAITVGLFSWMLRMERLVASISRDLGPSTQDGSIRNHLKRHSEKIDSHAKKLDHHSEMLEVLTIHEATAEEIEEMAKLAEALKTVAKRRIAQRAG